MADQDNDPKTETGKTRTWVTLPFKLPDDGELLEHLEIMVRDTRPATDQVKFIKWLIEKEWEDRQRIQHSVKKFRKALRGQPQNRAAAR